MAAFLMKKRNLWRPQRWPLSSTPTLTPTPTPTPTHAQPLSFSLRKGASSTSSASDPDDHDHGRSQQNQGNRFLLPGATIATLFMLGGLHARRLYDDHKAEEARQQRVELEFEPDAKAAFLQILPLRLISRTCGILTSLELPIWVRPYVYKGYARAFHANLEEAGEDLEKYTSVRNFFMRSLKEGCRPLDPDACCWVSPVDGLVLRCGQITAPDLSIQQVKGYSYSVNSLLGTEPQVLPSILETAAEKGPAQLPGSGLFYCVLYLGPGDYHRVHSPTDWQVFYRRHFSGRLYPVNERAARTISNLYAGNERVVLEGIWNKGFMALVAVGATNVGSIELKTEPDFITNLTRAISSNQGFSSVQKYGDGGFGISIRKGDEVARFNLGSTVILVFEAPVLQGMDPNGKSGFSFNVNKGERVRMGQAIGKWQD